MTEQERQVAMLAIQWSRDIRNCASQREASNMMRTFLAKLVAQLSKVTYEIVSQSDEQRLAHISESKLEEIKPGIMLASTLRQLLSRYWDLEVEADQAADEDDWGHSSFCETERREIETKVEAQGFTPFWNRDEEQWMLALKEEEAASPQVLDRLSDQESEQRNSSPGWE